MLCNLPYGLMDKALVFGAKDCRFESCEDLSLKQESVTDMLRCTFNIVALKTTYFVHARQKYH